jgi:hypothetical protein
MPGPRVTVTFTLSPADYAEGFDCDPTRLADGVRARLEEFYGDDAYPRFPQGIAISVTLPTVPADLPRLDAAAMRAAQEHLPPEASDPLGLSLGAVRRVAERLGVHPGVVIARAQAAGFAVRHVERV